MNRIFIIIFICLLLVGITSAYICIYQSDNIEVQKFKSKLNEIAIKQDIESGMTPEAINLKLKYFNPCGIRSK